MNVLAKGRRKRSEEECPPKVMIESQFLIAIAFEKYNTMFMFLNTETNGCFGHLVDGGRWFPFGFGTDGFL